MNNTDIVAGQESSEEGSRIKVDIWCGKPCDIQSSPRGGRSQIPCL